jgi:hypothetical protein
LPKSCLDDYIPVGFRRMNLTAERLIILLILGVLIVASGSSLMVSGPITEEEAIQIAKRSDAVREALAGEYLFFDVGAEYYNSSLIEKLRESHNGDDWVFRVPDGHAVWSVGWFIVVAGGGPGPYIGVGARVDAETGLVIAEFEYRWMRSPSMSQVEERL